MRRGHPVAPFFLQCGFCCVEAAENQLPGFDVSGEEDRIQKTGDGSGSKSRRRNPAVGMAKKSHHEGKMRRLFSC
jgi:hypothetical protein